jgi:hypothetical protein
MCICIYMFVNIQLVSVGGCKYLREFYFYPQSEAHRETQVLPKVISYLLKHLPQLQVRTNLHLISRIT